MPRPPKGATPAIPSLKNVDVEQLRQECRLALRAPAGSAKELYHARLVTMMMAPCLGIDGVAEIDAGEAERAAPPAAPLLVAGGTC